MVFAGVSTITVIKEEKPKRRESKQKRNLAPMYLLPEWRETVFCINATPRPRKSIRVPNFYR
jgi:hypothetical protein